LETYKWSSIQEVALSRGEVLKFLLLWTLGVNLVY
jgi:hypothetical protein